MSVKISQLSASAQITSDDFLPIVDSGSLTTKRASASQMLDYVTGSTFDSLTVTSLTSSYVSGTTVQFTDAHFITTTASYSLIQGDLRVLGTASIAQLTTISQSSLLVGDKYITILSGGVDHTGINGAGFLWGTSSGPGETTGALGEHAHVLYDASRDALEIFPGLYVTGSTALFDISGTTAQFTIVTGSTITGSLAKFTTLSASTAEFSGSVLIYGTASLSSNPSAAYLIYSSSMDKLVAFPGLFVSGNLTGSGLGAFQTVSASTGLFTELTASAGFSGDGSNLINVTASNIINFAQDVLNVISPFDYQVFTASGTWNKPTSFTPKFVMVQCFGAGAGGGGGACAVLATARQGGAGGGGGAYATAIFPAFSIGSSESVIVGTGGAGGTGQVLGGAVATTGQQGGSSSFGSSNSAFGLFGDASYNLGTYINTGAGGGGSLGSTGAVGSAGGGGGGTYRNGTAGTTTTAGNGGLPGGTSITAIGGQGAAGGSISTALSVTGGFAEYGGAGGGAHTIGGVAGPGGSSMYGGGGGGSGASNSTSGSYGGSSGIYAYNPSISTAAPGANTNTPGSPGLPGTNGISNTVGAGCGGGGGGSGTVANSNGGRGGNGGDRGGGGGGGGVGTGVAAFSAFGGAGGDGGRGEVRVFCW